MSLQNVGGLRYLLLFFVCGNFRIDNWIASYAEVDLSDRIGRVPNWCIPGSFFHQN
jgi:hypothetical protein